MIPKLVIAALRYALIGRTDIVRYMLSNHLKSLSSLADPTEQELSDLHSIENLLSENPLLDYILSQTPYHAESEDADESRTRLEHLTTIAWLHNCARMQMTKLAWVCKRPPRSIRPMSFNHRTAAHNLHAAKTQKKFENSVDLG